MEHICEYLLNVIVAAILCGIAMTLLDKKGLSCRAAKLLAGLLMIIVVLTPTVKLSANDLLDWTNELSMDGTDAAAVGENMAAKAYREGIITQVKAYILDEAQALGCDLQVEITLSNDAIAKPEQIRLSGNISPYARQILSNKLTQELGIDREDQIWTG